MSNTDTNTNTSLFYFIRDSWERKMLENAYQAISELELWDWLKMYEPGERGFMCSDDDNILIISEKMQLLPNPPNHSGSSFGYIMRTMEYIAKTSLDKLKEDFI
jgi:hypothetical protein